MSRPQKSRRICSMPVNTSFGPLDEHDASDVITMTVDEFEAIRLIDLLGLNQEECSKRMDIARTTAQAIYNSARKKLARCLVEGADLHVDGGEYNVCDGAGCTACSDCHPKAEQ